MGAYKKIVFILVFVFSGMGIASAQSMGNMIFFTSSPQTASLSALKTETERIIYSHTDSLGRFLPVERNMVQNALQKNRGMFKGNNLLKKVALDLNVDFFIQVHLYQQGVFTYGEIRVVPLDSAYNSIGKLIKVKSSIMQNVPLLLLREIVLLHEKLPIRTSLTSTGRKDVFLLQAGKWHGLEDGSVYDLEDGGSLYVEQTAQYSSFVRVKNSSATDVVILQYPAINAALERIEEDIENNIIRKHGIEYTLLKKVDAEKKLLEGVCVVNMGGNFCLPIYGSYLSTHYMGFENAKIAPYGLAAGTAVFSTQLAFVPIASRGDANFFPWIQDSDKTDGMKRLHMFLWASIPLTFSVSFYDQLTYQYIQNNILPPMFKERDSMAALSSFFIPGGGLFYKGYRYSGWGYFLTEMGLAGYGFYNLGDKKALYAFSVLGGIKLIELLQAYFISPSYSAYSDEFYRDRTTQVLIGALPSYRNDDHIYALAIQCNF